MHYQTIIYRYNGSSNSDIFSKLNTNGSIFVFFENTYNNNGFIEKNVFDVVDEMLLLGYGLINIIIHPIKPKRTKNSIHANVGHILWFTKNPDAFFFSKDEIREKHIWKDVEWGKREKNYNPLGKDPGNVWIPTLDNGKGKVTEHIILTNEELINRCVKSTSIQGDSIYIEFGEINIKNIINGRKITFVESNKKTGFQIHSGISGKKKNPKSDDNLLSGDIYFSTSESMTPINDGVVDLMVTSPPYWDLKNYFKKGQIGHESYEEYLSRMGSVWSETYRVLKDTGSMWININTRTKNKKPILIPNDIIKQCRDIGFYLKDIIIWHKSSGIPVGKNNVVDRFEYFLWFTKSQNCYLNIYDFTDYKNSTLDNGLIWNINRKAGSVGKDYIHPAVYPNELIDRVINLCSKENDIILDPFLGSGTSMISALKNKRNFVGFEFNENFENLIKYRVDNEIPDMEKFIKYNLSKKRGKSSIFRK